MFRDLNGVAAISQMKVITQRSAVLAMAHRSAVRAITQRSAVRAKNP